MQFAHLLLAQVFFHYPPHCIECGSILALLSLSEFWRTQIYRATYPH